MQYHLNSADIAWRVVEEEVVLIHIPTSFYFSINRSGSYIWNHLSSRACSPDQLAQAVSQRYQIDQKLALAAVQTFLDALLLEGLIVAHQDMPESTAALSDTAAGRPEHYDQPTLLKYEQLEKVLVSGE